MKRFKKIVSLFMALAMVFAMGITSFADGSTSSHTITIKYQRSGHTYNAYQVFTGNAYDDAVLTNVKWGNGVNDTALLEELKKSAVFGDLFKNCSTAADVVAKISDDSFNTTTNLEEFSRIVITCKNESNAIKSTQQIDTDGKFVEDSEGYFYYDINVTGDGYYIIEEDLNSMSDDDGSSATNYIMKVLNDMEVVAKAPVIDIDKKIVEEDGSKVSYNNAAVGDVLTFEVTSTVPDMYGYSKYFFVVNDTLSSGLTFDNTSVTVKVGDKLLENGTGYYVEDNSEQKAADADTDIKIVLKNFIQYNTSDYKDKPIVITYKATVNDNAVIGSVGNPNSVQLTYSRNFNIDTDNDTDEPSYKDPVGTTPVVKTRTYITGVEIFKVDGEDQTTPLEGAIFKIENYKDENNLNTVITYGDEFIEDSDGEYWLLSDGTYTTTDPNEAGVNKNKYDSASIDKKFRKETTYKQTIEKSPTVSYEATTGSDGILRLEGLKAGKYEITEILAPSGYNKLDDKYILDITWAAPGNNSTDDKCTWTVTAYKNEIDPGNVIATSVYQNTGTQHDKIVGEIAITIENNKGTTLPETGGTGVKTLYTIGAILVLGASILLITRRRMKMMD